MLMREKIETKIRPYTFYYFQYRERRLYLIRAAIQTVFQQYSGQCAKIDPFTIGRYISSEYRSCKHPPTTKQTRTTEGKVT